MNIKDAVKPLPANMVQRYKGWRATDFSENESWYSHLATHGQNPRTMIVSCCDSRLHLTAMFGADSGEIFIHRNIANLIPQYEADDSLHGTSAAIEYAVRFLNVANLVIVGHSQCGGVAGAYDICREGKKLNSEFLEPWLELLRPGYEHVAKAHDDREEALRAMEKQSVVISLQNLASFPFVADAVKEKRLVLHGLWHDIGAGMLYQYNIETDSFEALA